MYLLNQNKFQRTLQSEGTKGLLHIFSLVSNLNVLQSKKVGTMKQYLDILIRSRFGSGTHSDKKDMCDLVFSAS
jgi:hypothetical protein